MRAYLRNAVNNRIKDELRKASHAPHLEELPEVEATGFDASLIAGGASPLDCLLEDERDALFARALACLRDTERTAIVARLRLGYSYEQIAFVMGKRSPDAARMAVARAIERVGQLITEFATIP